MNKLCPQQCSACDILGFTTMRLQVRASFMQHTSDLHELNIYFVLVITAVRCADLQTVRWKLKISRIFTFLVCMCSDFSGEHWFVCLSYALKTIYIFWNLNPPATICCYTNLVLNLVQSVSFDPFRFLTFFTSLFSASASIYLFGSCTNFYMPPFH